MVLAIYSATGRCHPGPFHFSILNTLAFTSGLICPKWLPWPQTLSLCSRKEKEEGQHQVYLSLYQESKSLFIGHNFSTWPPPLHPRQLPLQWELGRGKLRMTVGLTKSSVCQRMHLEENNPGACYWEEVRREALWGYGSGLQTFLIKIIKSWFWGWVKTPFRKQIALFFYPELAISFN